MKANRLLLFAILAFGLPATSFSQTMSGIWYSYGAHEYVEDFQIGNGRVFTMVRQKINDYNESVVNHFLLGDFLDGSRHSILLHTLTDSLRFKVDNSGRIYIGGHHQDPIMGSPRTLFVKSFDPYGQPGWVWTSPLLAEKVGMFLDRQGNPYVYDDLFLYKLNPQGNLSWKKSLSGKLHLSDNQFYRIHSSSVIQPYYYQCYNSDIMLSGIDTSGQVLSEAPVIQNSGWIQIGFRSSVYGGRIFISGKYFGKLDFDPSADSLIFINNRWNHGPHIDNPIFENFLAVYDTSGALLWAMAGPKFPEVRNATADASGKIYISGPYQGEVDFALRPGVTRMDYPTDDEKSFLVTYSPSRDLIRIGRMTGHIMHMGISDSLYRWGGKGEKLYISGHVNGFLNFDLDNPTQHSGESTLTDVFVAFSGPLNEGSSSLLPGDLPSDEYLLSVYPNPARGNVTISLNKPAGDIELTLFDTQGKVCLTRRYQENLSGLSLDLNRNRKGIYYVRLMINGHAYTEKIVLTE